MNFVIQMIKLFANFLNSLYEKILLRKRRKWVKGQIREIETCSSSSNMVNRKGYGGGGNYVVACGRVPNCGSPLFV